MTPIEQIFTDKPSIYQRTVPDYGTFTKKPCYRWSVKMAVIGIIRVLILDTNASLPGNLLLSSSVSMSSGNSHAPFG
jgi:hypothetical protein